MLLLVLFCFLSEVCLCWGHLLWWLASVPFLQATLEVLWISALTVAPGQGVSVTWELCGNADAQALLETPESNIWGQGPGTCILLAPQGFCWELLLVSLWPLLSYSCEGCGPLRPALVRLGAFAQPHWGVGMRHESKSFLPWGCGGKREWWVSWPTEVCIPVSLLLHPYVLGWISTQPALCILITILTSLWSL